MSRDETQSHPTMCRVCAHACGVVAETRGGQLTRITGDADNPLFRGYICVKGRGHAALYDHPDRLRHSLKRTPAGEFQTIPVEDAMDEIAERLRQILDRHGPRAFATYWATYFGLDHPAHMTYIDAFARAVGTPMVFSPFTTDQPGKVIAKGLHGMWMAPVRFREPEAVLLIGTNPLISHQHRTGNPGDFFKDLDRRNAQLVVIDPRRTETARRATLHLQPRPGQDAAILACLIRQIIADGLHDQVFIDDNVSGFDELALTVAPFDPVSVAERAGVPAEELIAAARILGSTRYGYVTSGTGPNMSGEGTLIEYLVLCLDTVCGHWMRAGELITNAYTLVPQAIQPAKAQPLPPFPTYDLGEKSRVRGLTQTALGMPAAAMAEEILLPGDGQVRALLSLGGNPLNSVPDQPKMHRALTSLDLLVCTDMQMSPTAKLADYVIAPKLPLEMPGTSLIIDFLSMFANGVGPTHSYAQYTPQIIDPPNGSDVIAQWELLHGLARRLGLELSLLPGAGKIVPAGDTLTTLDMAGKPSDEDLLDIVHAGSRVPLDEIRRHPHGAFYPEPAVHVQPRDPACRDRLQVGDPGMLAELGAVAVRTTDVGSRGYPFRLISRRMMHVVNTPTIAAPTNRRAYNPAFMHPDDLAKLQLAPGDIGEIASEYSSMLAVVEADDTVRRGVISMSHSYGDTPDHDQEVRAIGSNPGRLVSSDTFYDHYTGQPRMSNIPVRVTAPPHPEADDRSSAPAAHGRHAAVDLRKDVAPLKT